MSKRKILIVEDNLINRDIINNILKDDYIIIQAENGQIALDIIKESYDTLSAILLDLVMPIMDGYDVLKEMNNNPDYALIPVIVMTADNQIGSEVKALSLGATDFIVKPCNPETLKHRLRNTIKLRETASIVNATRVDALTGLASRFAFYEEVERLVSSKPSSYYVMASFDIDGFKVINEQYGSKYGDDIIKRLANILSTGFSNIGGMCCRIIDDNFAVIYPTSYIDSNEVLEIQQQIVYAHSSTSLLNFSVGRYIINDVNMRASTMYDRSVMAKLSIKGRFDTHTALYDDTMRSKLMIEREITQDMVNALNNKQFEVWLQPQVNHATRAIIGSEALVRWRHPTKGLISPAVFIPIFEKNGFIYELDKYVWESTCQILRKWLDEDFICLPISINISRYDVIRTGCFEFITSLMTKYNLPIDLLHLEITESAFLENSTLIIDFVKKLVSYGFIMEIDDFGSGYSSLNTLKDVPAEILKLDMKFLKGKDNLAKGGNIIASIVRMAKWIGMSVIAEGVETIEQADYLKSIGCNYIQGYLYAKPMMVSEYEALVNKSLSETNPFDIDKVKSIADVDLWNPQSMETLVFNNFVGGATIFEYYKGKVEILRVNDAYIEMLAGNISDKDKIMNIDWLKYTDEADQIKIFKVIEEVISTRQEVSDLVKFHGLPHQTKPLYIRSTMRVIAQVNDRYLIYNKLENVTLYIEAERHAKVTSDQLHLLLNNIDMVIIVYQFNIDQFVYFNDKYYELLGYTKEEYIKEIHSINDVINPDDVQRMKDIFASLDANFTSTIIELTIKGKNNQIIKTRSAISLVTGYNEKLFLLSIKDISIEKKQAEEILEVSESLTNFINDSPGGFIRLLVLPNKKLKVSLLNNGLKVMFNKDIEELKTLYENNLTWNVHPDDVNNVKNEFNKLFRKKQPITIKYRLIQPDNTYKYYLVFARYIKLNGLDYINIFYTDINIQTELETNQMTLIENLPCGASIYEVNNHTIKPIYINNQYRKLVGRTIDDLANASILDNIKEEDREIFIKAVRQAVKENTVINCDINIIHGNGSYILFHITGNIIQYSQTKMLIYATFVPLSPAELAYKDMIPVALEAMMKSTSTLLFIKDSNYRYICCSKAFAQMVGFEDEKDIYGKTDFDIFTNELALRYHEDDKQLFLTEQAIIDKVEIIPSKDQKTHYSSTSKYVLYDSSGNKIGLYGVGIDITKNKETYTRLKLVTDNMPGCIAMYSITSDKVVPIYYSDKVNELFGINKNEQNVYLHDPLKAIHPDDLPLVKTQLEKLINENTPIDCVIRVITQNDIYKWINVKGTIIDPTTKYPIINTVLFDVTAEKEIDIALKASNKALEIATQISGISFWIYDLDKKTVSRKNIQSTSILGYEDEIANVPDSLMNTGYIYKSDEEKYIKMYEDLAKGSKKTECTARLLNRKTMKYEWHHIVYHVLDDDYYQARSAVGFSINIDLEQENRIRYEHELKLRHEMIKNSVFYYQLNLTKELIEEYYSKPNDIKEMKSNVITSDALREAILTKVIDTDKEKVRNTIFSQALLKAYQKGINEVHIEYRRSFPNEGIKWIKVDGSIIENPNTGDIIAFLYANDIDLWKKDQLAITTIMDEEIDAVALVNVKSGLAHFVQIQQDYYGININEFYSFDDIFKNQIYNVVISEDMSNCFEFFSIKGLIKQLKNDEVIKIIYRLKNNDGSIKRKKTRAFYLDETHEDIVLIRRDITDLYEEEQRQQKILQIAIDNANIANIAKSAFISRMSHDMRTPLNAILTLSSDEMIKGINKNVLLDYLQKIHKSGNYLLGIINDVLDMSKIEQKKLKLNSTPYSLNEFIDMINTVIGELCKNKSLTFIINKINAEPVGIITDKIRFNQIFINLLSNAVKFTPEGGKIELIIDNYQEPYNGTCYKRFIVNDTGLGMSKDFIPHAFESFTQEYHQDISENYQGTGLGLAIVKQIVELMHGKVMVESIINEGTSFIIELPLQIATGAFLDDFIEKEDFKLLDNLQVLLCEDNYLNTEIVVTLLQKHGCIVTTASNGKIGYDKFIDSTDGFFDVILMDIRMPILNGIESTILIRHASKKDALTIPIIAMTADAFLEDEQKALEAGMDAFIAKPINTTQLYNIIIMCVKNKKINS